MKHFLPSERSSIRVWVSEIRILGLGFSVRVGLEFRIMANFRVRVSYRVVVKVMTIYDAGTFGRKEMFYLTTHSTHFIYGYMASDIW